MSEESYPTVWAYEQACAALERTKTENGELKAENDAMRAIIANSPAIPCIYCGAGTMARCPRGFPGCGQADDLMVSGDEAMKRSLDQKNAHIAELRSTLEQCAVLFVDLRDDWSDNRGPCREGIALINKVLQ
jgi:hypothetical protein